MSKIEITSSNIDKFVKRFHKVSDAKNNGKKLSESQETFAQSLGCQNYNELKTILEKENIPDNKQKTSSSKNELYKGWTIDNADNLKLEDFLTNVDNLLIEKSNEMSEVELFYNQLVTLINNPKSKISSCLFEKYNFEYSLKFKTCYGDEFSYVFGKHEKLLVNSLNEEGFSLIDSFMLNKILANTGTNKIRLDNRFEAIDFANDIYQYLSEKMGEQTIYVLKFNKEDSVNNKYILKNNTLYEHQLIFLCTSDYESIIKATQSISIESKEKFGFYVFKNMFEHRTNNGQHKLDYYKNIGNSQNIIIRKTDLNLDLIQQLKFNKKVI